MLPLKINTVILKGNDVSNFFEISDFIQFAKEHQIDNLKFYVLISNPVFNAKESFLKHYVYWDDAEIIKQLSDNFGENYKTIFYNENSNHSMISTKIGQTTVSFSLLRFGRQKNFSECAKCLKADCCQEGKYYQRVMPDGNVKSCLLNNQALDKKIVEK